MDNVLPFASRRIARSVEMILREPEIQNLFSYHEIALAEIFNYFSSPSESDSPGKRRNGSGSSPRLQELSMDEPSLCSAIDGEPRKLKGRTQRLMTNHKRDHLSYQSALCLMNEFSLNVSLNITAFELGNIFLSITERVNFTPELRKLTFLEFWELLVACAIYAFNGNDVPNVDKVKVRKYTVCVRMIYFHN